MRVNNTVKIIFWSGVFVACLYAKNKIHNHNKEKERIEYEHRRDSILNEMAKEDSVYNLKLQEAKRVADSIAHKSYFKASQAVRKSIRK